MSQKQFPIPTYGFLRLPQVLAIIPISKSAWWEGCRIGRFPRPVKLGPRTTVWRAEEIAAFIDQAGIQCETDSHDQQ
ncbi:helix-turn-helix transcriptional regulator [Desulfovibrio desulfuricans]|uniref:helix-turn-helix transcriptional regulator n=1 Tax=Desulfovibrio desulfuricans TaxID=876 RepID=UPI0035B17C99